jgi:hypothetical protein
MSATEEEGEAGRNCTVKEIYGGFGSSQCHDRRTHQISPCISS